MKNKKKQLIRKFRKSKEAKNADNSTVYNKVMVRAGQMNCIYCPEWENDNKIKRKPKRGAKRPCYKNKRRA